MILTREMRARNWRCRAGLSFRAPSFSLKRTRWKKVIFSEFLTVVFGCSHSCCKGSRTCSLVRQRATTQRSAPSWNAKWNELDILSRLLKLAVVSQPCFFRVHTGSV